MVLKHTKQYLSLNNHDFLKDQMHGGNIETCCEVSLKKSNLQKKFLMKIGEQKHSVAVNAHLLPSWEESFALECYQFLF